MKSVILGLLLAGMTCSVGVGGVKITTSSVRYISGKDSIVRFLGVPEDRATRDLAASVQYLKSRIDVDSSRIGSIGWCMGSGYSLVTVLNVRDLAACVVCYGRLVTDSSSIAKIPCPILGIFGEKDRGIPPGSVREFDAECKKAGKNIEVVMYKNAGHAFMNPNNKDGYRNGDAVDAWSRISSFFAEKLKKDKKAPLE